MATTVIAATLKLDTAPAEGSVRSFRTQLREASANLIQIQEQFGETSTQAVAAAHAVAQLRDRLGDARQISDAFNPDAKFQAFTKVLSGAAGGVTALTGAMALFGSESEDVQKALLKVQGALALSQGLSQIGELGKSFAILKVVAVDAFNGIKTAIGSTGIGAIVIAVGLLFTYWDDIKGVIGLANKEEEKNLKTSKEQYDIEKQKLDVIQSQNNILKQQGKSQQEILEIQDKQLETTIKSAIANLEAQKKIADVALGAAIGKNIAATQKIGKSLADFFFDVDKIKKEGDKSVEAIGAEIVKLQDKLAGNQDAILKSTSDFQQKLLSLTHDAGEAGITDAYALSQIKLKNEFEAQKIQAGFDYDNIVQRNEVISGLTAKFEAQQAALYTANQRKRADERRKASFDAYTANIQDQTVLAELTLKFQLENDQRQAALDYSNIDQRNAKLLQLQNVYDAKLSEIKLKNLQDFQAKWRDANIAKRVADEDLQQAELDALISKEEEQRQKRLQILKDSASIEDQINIDKLGTIDSAAAESLKKLYKEQGDKLALVTAGSDAEKAIHEETERKKTEISDIQNAARLSILSTTLANASTLLGKNTVAGKGLAIAATLIDTYQAGFSAFKGMVKAIPGPIGIAAGIVAAAGAVAAGLATVKKIVSVPIPGVSGGSGSVPNVSVSAPLAPQVQTTQLPQDQINQIGQAGNQTARAFVVESDITGSQERINRLNRQARLGN